MPAKKRTIELPMVNAEEHISVFFHNNQALIDTFNAICAHMLDLNNGLMFRTNGRIIGIGKHGEFYRLYVSKKDGEYFIKYKNRKVRERIVPSNLEMYFAYNTSCNEFCSEKQSSLGVKKHDQAHNDASERMYRPVSLIGKPLEEWRHIQKKAESSLPFANYHAANAEYVDTVYGEIITLLSEAASNRELIAARDGDIVVSRVLSQTPAALQELGEKHGVSRECIRQREKKTWRKLTFGIYRYKKFASYKEALKCILQNIPNEIFINTIVQIYRRNAVVGFWLQKIVTGADDENDVSLMIKN